MDEVVYGDHGAVFVGENLALGGFDVESYQSDLIQNLSIDLYDWIPGLLIGCYE